MRARYPDHEGYVDSEGVEIFYEVYENDGPTLLFVPPSPITHSRIWKGQIPYLSRHFRVLTMDGRGNGKSGRPEGPENNTLAQNQADIVAVLDASETDRAVLVALCHANWWAVEVIATHRQRAQGLVAIEPGVPYLGPTQPQWIQADEHWDEVFDEPTGWELCSRHAMTHHYQEWIEFFFDQQLVEPHSTKQFEDAVAWALETTGGSLVAEEEAESTNPPSEEEMRDTYRNLGVPVLVIHGSADICQHVDRGRAFADITGGEMVVIEGGGHLTPARDPVKVNAAIKDFVDRTAA